MTKTALVSGLCVTALLAYSASAQQPPSGAMAGPPPGADKVHEACAAEMTKFCSDVKPGGGHIMHCLGKHKDDLSDGCKQALAAAKAAHQQPQPTPGGRLCWALHVRRWIVRASD